MVTMMNNDSNTDVYVHMKIFIEVYPVNMVLL